MPHDEDRPVTLLELDLTDLDAVDRIGPTIAQRFGKLDIVVGNAGLLGDVADASYRRDVWTEVVDVNLNANWRLIRTTDPSAARQSDAGRAVFVPAPRMANVLTGVPMP